MVFRELLRAFSRGVQANTVTFRVNIRDKNDLINVLNIVLNTNDFLYFTYSRGVFTVTVTRNPTTLQLIRTMLARLGLRYTMS